MHVIGVVGLTVFAAWTLVTVLLALPAQLLALPFDPDRRVAAALARLSWGFGLFHGQPFWRLRRTGLERCAGGPFVIVANHQSFLDIPLLMTLPIPIRVLARPGVFAMPVYGQMARLGGHVRLEEDVALTVARCKALLARGISVVVFPEGTRSEDGALGPFHRGAVQIAMDAGVPLLPVCIEGTRLALPKGQPYGYAPLSRIHLQVLEPLDPGGARRTVGQRLRARIEAARVGPRPWELAAKVGARYRPQGRWREGWARGKTSFDPVFWALWERLPREGLVLDLGCGEGLLAAWLEAAGGAQVRGWDVDAGRVAVARAAGVEAEVGDCRGVALPEADAIVLIDVLHYLAPEEQAAVLRRCAAALRPGGMLLARDPDLGRGAASWWTTTSERLFVATGRHAGEGVRARGGAALAQLFAAELAEVRVEDCSTGPFANVLVSGRKP